MVELVHFLLGATCGTDSICRSEKLLEHTFGLDFDLAGTLTIVERSGANKSKVEVVNGDTSEWPLQPTSAGLITNTNWRAVLGALMFGLPAEADDEGPKWKPTFRSLFSYFVRRESGKAFSVPFRQSAQQQLFDEQIAVSFLLGLDWTISAQLQDVRIREKALKAIRDAAAQQAFGTVVGTAADLRTRLAVAEDRGRGLRRNLEGFQVLAEYPELEDEASRLTIEMGKLADENTIDRQVIAELEAAAQQEPTPSYDDLEAMYREAGVSLPELVIKRFDEVVRFHQSVVRNRHAYLGGEIESAQRRIDERSATMTGLDARKAEIMSILKAHGALDQYMQLQSELSRVEVEAENLRIQLTAAEQVEGKKTELEIERARLRLRLKQDFSEQTDVLNEAFVAFEEISNHLYETAGSLVVDDTPNGPAFEVRIHGSRSKGVSNMQIFCFDLMLMRLCAERKIGPGFLVHDSHLFDGVDARQIAHALQSGAKMAEEYGFQYIVTLNSDSVPREWLRADFALDRYVLEPRITDETEEGGLFGLRFA